MGDKDDTNNHEKRGEFVLVNQLLVVFSSSSGRHRSTEVEQKPSHPLTRLKFVFVRVCIFFFFFFLVGFPFAPLQKKNVATPLPCRRY